MTSITQTPSNERMQWVTLAILSLGVAGFTGILSLSQGAFSQPYFGNINPLLAITLVAVVGIISLRSLHLRGWFEIYSKGKCLRGAFLSTTLATLFAIAMILVDLKIVFPKNPNVPPPQSLLFYPAVAYVAEIVFHALPLVLLLAFLGPLCQKLYVHSLVWCCILLVSFLEPLFQLGLGFPVYVGLHVFVFNLLQLYVFRRYDFVSMYSFRLVYYLQWHVVWGYLRLQLLF